MRLTSLENRVSRELAAPVHVAVCTSDRGCERLNAGERAQLVQFRTEARRRDWRRGRLALKSVLRSLGRPDDTSGVRLPAAQLSLTHGDGTAFAVGTPVAGMRIGVDFEALRPVHERIARWFLNGSEIEQLPHGDAGERGRTLVRLWTVKEAVFKCHPGNRELVLTDFTIADPASECCAIRAADGRRFRCISTPVDAGFISIATSGDRNEN